MTEVFVEQPLALPGSAKDLMVCFDGSGTIKLTLGYVLVWISGNTWP